MKQRQLQFILAASASVLFSAVAQDIHPEQQPTLPPLPPTPSGVQQPAPAMVEESHSTEGETIPQEAQVQQPQPRPQFAPTTQPPAAQKPTAPGVVRPLSPKPNMPAPVVPAPQYSAPEKLYSLSFEGADLSMVLEEYSRWTGRTIIKNDSLTATITLKGKQLTHKQRLEAVEMVLEMNNVALVPFGDKFLKVVQAGAGDLVGQGTPISMNPEQQFKDSAKLVTHVIQLKHTEIPQIQTAVQHIMNAFGKIQTLEGVNSLMITDTASNLKRILELIEFLDQATPGIEPRIYNLKHADATELAAKLTEIVTIAQEDQKAGGGGATISTRPTTTRTPPGVIRAQVPAGPTQATISRTEGSNPVMIQGTVKVMADERTNILIIFSPESNFAFFDRIIKVLDIEVEPAISFEVVNLEYADAEEISGTLNDLIGAAQGGNVSGGISSSSRSRTSSSSSRSNRNSSSRSSRSSRNTSRNNNSSNNSRGIQSPMTTLTDESATTGVELANNLNQLSESTRILADMRTNSLLLMGRKQDIAALKHIIAQLDIMLEQVLIEAAIFEVSLSDRYSYGLQWLFNEGNADNKVVGWQGTSLANTNNPIVGSALSYYQAISGIDTRVAIQMSKTDSDARLLSSPVIMTLDNTEAILTVGEQRPVITATESTYSSTQRSSYQYKDIGIELAVTPRINPQNFVVMEIAQKADQLGELVKIDDNEVPTIRNRQFEASVAVPDKGTVALGGLVSTEKRDSVSKIPLLGDIPLIGRYLFSSVSKDKVQQELIVLLTPHVLTNPRDMNAETKRLYDATNMTKEDWPENWSDNKLHDEDPDDELGRQIEQMLIEQSKRQEAIQQPE